MIANLKPYKDMRDSGVPWLGEAPGHWEVRRLKRVVSFSGGGTPSKANAAFWGGDIPWVSPKDMAHPQITNAADHITKEAVASSATNLVAPGALLMVVRSGILRRTIPVGINTVEVALNQDIKALRPKAGVVQSEYLRALVQGNEAALIREWSKHGATVESIEQDILANSSVPLPPLAEQAAIVRFVGYADGRIRRYIRAKQKLIKLLEEQKQAIIHRAVTCGLDRNVRLKPSGVEWLGDVPEHWEVAALRRRWSVTDCKHLTVPFVDDENGIPLASVREVQSFELSLKTAKRTSQKYYESLIEGDRHPRKGDLIYCRNVSVGAAAIVTSNEPLAMGQDVCLIRSRDENQRYLNYFLRSPAMRDQLSMLLVGSTFNRINVADIKALAVVIPPRKEQDAIAGFLDRELKETVYAQTLGGEEISLLREFRIRLIADVVTGKLDVREAAARLPDEADEIDPIDEADALRDAEEAASDDLDAIPEESQA